MTEKKRGKFIVIEGADGVGTTTQSKLLAQRWNKTQPTKAMWTCQPSNGRIGKEIRAILAGDKPEGIGWQKLALLFAADRLDHIQNFIVPALEEGTTVICDRYMLSSFVYQGLTCDSMWITEINIHHLSPDLTVLLSVPVDVTAKRIAEREGAEEIFDKNEFREQIHQGYLQCYARQHEARYRPHPGWKLEGDYSIADTTNLIWEALKEKGLLDE